MQLHTISTFLYGTLLLVGGIIGHFKAHSQASLIMGIVSSFAVYFCTWALWKKKSWGFNATLATVFILLCFFIYRFNLTQKFMPPGLLAIVSLIVLISLYYSKKNMKA